MGYWPAGYDYKEAIDDETREWRYFSPSTLMSADPGTSEGCMRKLYYEKILKLKGPEQAWQTLGKELHAQNEHYLKTGEKNMGSLALAGIHMLPKPMTEDPRLLVEHEIGGGILARVPLRAAGVPVVGFIDCIHWQGTNAGTSDITDTLDPPGTIEVIDWKCLAAGSEIFDVLHARRRDVSETGVLSVATYNTPNVGGELTEPLRRSVGSATSFASGSKQCVRVTLKDGTTLTASTDHPILTQRGWVEASKLLASDFVAVAANAPEPQTPTEATDTEVKFVAYMLSDGGCSRPENMGFTNMTPTIIEEWSACAVELGYRIGEDKSKSKARQFRLYDGKKRILGTTKWSDDPIRVRWDLFGLAKEKRMHADLWGLPRKQVALFLNRFWACDGFISDHAFAVQLASERLVDDLKFLLLRLGIRARKYFVPKGEFNSWLLAINGAEALKFHREVGDILGKEEQCWVLKTKLLVEGSHSKWDVIPFTSQAITATFDELALQDRTTARTRLGVTKNNTLSRSRFVDFCKEYNYTGKYAAFNSSDVHWERVKSICDAGELPVYDLNVPETHSFVANGIVVHNTTSDLKWAKSAQEVSRTLQMTTYGKWAVDVRGAEHVRLSHGYYVTKGKATPRKVSLRVHKDTINKRWEYVESLASSLVEVVKETDVNKVPANTRACGAFRGCPHASYCTAASHNSLSSIIGSSFASTLLGLEQPSVQTLPEYSQGSTMSLLAKLQAANSPKPDAPKPEVASEMRRLALEEINIKYPGIGEVFAGFDTLGMGMPQLSGEAAKVYAIVKDLDSKGEGFAGSGELGAFNFDDAGQLAAVLEEAKSIKASRQGSAEVTTVASASPFPDDAPPPLASPPEKVAKAEPVLTAEEAIAVAAGEKKPKVKKPTKKEIEAEKARIQTQQPHPDSPEYRATVPADSTEVIASAAESLQEVNLSSELATSIVKSVVEDGRFGAGEIESTAINLFVDCIPSVEYQSFWPIVKKVTDAIAKEYGGLDYRTCKKDSLAGFGGWKGLLAYGLSRLPIAGGNYVLDNAMTETGGIVVEAMIEIVAKSGGMMVRGIR